MTHEPPASSGASEHLELDQVADLDEGLLAPGEAAAANEHLAGCPVCRQRLASLRQTRALLSALPSEQMPASVVARIDAALAGAGAPTTVVPLDAKRRGWRAHPTAAGLGAAAAVAALVAALVVGHTSSNSSDQPDQQAGTGGALATKAQLTLPPSAVTGTSYSPKNLDRTVPLLLTPQTAAMQAQPEGSTPTPQTEAGTADSSSIPSSLSRLFSSPGALDSCVRGVASTGSGAPLTPLAIDFARYGGAPAVLIVLPGLEEGKVDAWFVGPDCVSADPHLLHYEAVPAPASSSPAP